MPVSPITTHSTRRTHLAPFCLGCEGHVHGVSPNTLRCKAYISILYYLELYKLSYQRSSPAQTVLDSHNLSPSSDYSHTITPRPRPPTGELENSSRQFLPVQSHSTPRCARMSQSLSHMSHPHVSLTCLPREQCRHPCKALCSEGRSASIREDIPQSAISNHRPVFGGGAASGTGCAGGGVPPPGGGLSGPSEGRRLSGGPLLLAIRWNKVRHKVSVYIEPSPPLQIEDLDRGLRSSG